MARIKERMEDLVEKLEQKEELETESIKRLMELYYCCEIVLCLLRRYYS